jgi:hypothetical protein
MCAVTGDTGHNIICTTSYSSNDGCNSLTGKRGNRIITFINVVTCIFVCECIRHTKVSGMTHPGALEIDSARGSTSSQIITIVVGAMEETVTLSA